MSKIEELINQLIVATKENGIHWEEGNSSARPFFQFFTKNFRVKFYPFYPPDILNLKNRELIFLNNNGGTVVSTKADESAKIEILLTELEKNIEEQKERIINAEIDKISQEVKDLYMQNLLF